MPRQPCQPFKVKSWREKTFLLFSNIQSFVRYQLFFQLRIFGGKTKRASISIFNSSFFFVKCKSIQILHLRTLHSLYSFYKILTTPPILITQYTKHCNETEKSMIHGPKYICTKLERPLCHLEKLPFSAHLRHLRKEIFTKFLIFTSFIHQFLFSSETQIWFWTYALWR